METNKTFYEKARWRDYSLEMFEDDGELFADNNSQEEEIWSEKEKDLLLECLTNRQRQVAVLLFEGFDRPGTARSLKPPVCLQAINQIIIRIRKRLAQRAGVDPTGWKRRHGAY